MEPRTIIVGSMNVGGFRFHSALPSSEIHFRINWEMGHLMQMVDIKQRSFLSNILRGNILQTAENSLRSDCFKVLI